VPGGGLPWPVAALPCRWRPPVTRAAFPWPVNGD